MLKSSIKRGFQTSIIRHPLQCGFRAPCGGEKLLSCAALRAFAFS